MCLWVSALKGASGNIACALLPQPTSRGTCPQTLPVMPVTLCVRVVAPVPVEHWACVCFLHRDRRWDYRHHRANDRGGHSQHQHCSWCVRGVLHPSSMAWSTTPCDRVVVIGVLLLQPKCSSWVSLTHPPSPMHVRHWSHCPVQRLWHGVPILAVCCDPANCLSVFVRQAPNWRTLLGVTSCWGECTNERKS